MASSYKRSAVYKNGEIGYFVTEVNPNADDVMNRIGKFRYDVWDNETEVNKSLFPDKSWIEDIDYSCRHWIAEDVNGILVGVARCSIHSDLLSNPDGYLWNNINRPLPLPAGHLCKLSVHSSARGLGIGMKLNEIRIAALKEMGAKCIIVTASEANSKLLFKQGFVDSGIRESFDNRPNMVFRGLELIF